VRPRLLEARDHGAVLGAVANLDARRGDAARHHAPKHGGTAVTGEGGGTLERVDRYVGPHRGRGRAGGNRRGDRGRLGARGASRREQEHGANGEQERTGSSQLWCPHFSSPFWMTLRRDRRRTAGVTPRRMPNPFGCTRHATAEGAEVLARRCLAERIRPA